MQLPVLVITSDRYLWALQPFAHLFNSYWSTLQPVYVIGFKRPSLRLPDNFTFIQLANSEYPPERWSDALIQGINHVVGDYMVIMLEDYWLSRTVDLRGVQACHQYAINHPNVVRFDLTGDRLYAGGMVDVEPWGCYDIIETPSSTPYQMSLQAAIWNISLLKQLLVPGKTAWQVEIHTPVPDTMRVLGTRQWPLRYANAIHKGKIDRAEISHLEYHVQATIERMIPDGWYAEVPE